MRRGWKRRDLGIVLVLVLSTLAWSGDSDLKLELESGVRTLRLGQKTTLKLRLAGAAIGRLTEKSEGILSANDTAGSFVYEFTFEPQREGQFTFGPYSLSFNGRPLVSNSLSISVSPAWDGTYGTFFRTDSDNITLGDKIELTIETWCTQHEVKHWLFKRSDAFTCTPGESFMSGGTFGKDTQLWYSRMIWWITPKQPGEFKITREMFEDFPEGLEAPNLIVTVREPIPPTNGKK